MTQTKNHLAEAIIFERAIGQIQQAIAHIGIALDDLGDLPESRNEDEITNAVQDSREELSTMKSDLHQMLAWAKARRDATGHGHAVR